MATNQTTTSRRAVALKTAPSTKEAVDALYSTLYDVDALLAGISSIVNSTTRPVQDIHTIRLLVDMASYRLTSIPLSDTPDVRGVYDVLDLVSKATSAEANHG